eukprot:SAG31_NODE_829_length_11709_cov_5.435917_1_plen_149_part_00
MALRSATSPSASHRAYLSVTFIAPGFESPGAGAQAVAQDGSPPSGQTGRPLVGKPAGCSFPPPSPAACDPQAAAVLVSAAWMVRSRFAPPPPPPVRWDLGVGRHPHSAPRPQRQRSWHRTASQRADGGTGWSIRYSCRTHRHRASTQN